MPILRIEQIQEGMELAEDVLDRNGQPLLRSGTTVSDKDLRRFRMWGIDELAIAGADEIAPSEPEIDPAVLAACEPEAMDMFSQTDMAHPLNALLLQECIKALARQKRMGRDA